MKFLTLTLALGFLALAQVSRPALAATITASFSVTATILSSCQVAAPATAPGTYTATRANITSSVSVTCTNPTPYNVSYSAGLAPSATTTTRKAAGPDTVAGTGSRSSQPDTVSGQSAGAQHVVPDAYTDLVTATITY